MATCGVLLLPNNLQPLQRWVVQPPASMEPRSSSVNGPRSTRLAHKAGNRRPDGLGNLAAKMRNSTFPSFPLGYSAEMRLSRVAAHNEQMSAENPEIPRNKLGFAKVGLRWVPTGSSLGPRRVLAGSAPGPPRWVPAGSPPSPDPKKTQKGPKKDPKKKHKVTLQDKRANSGTHTPYSPVVRRNSVANLVEGSGEKHRVYRLPLLYAIWILLGSGSSGESARKTPPK